MGRTRRIGLGLCVVALLMGGTGCTSLKETGRDFAREAGEALKAAGKDIAAEMRVQARETVKDLVEVAKAELAASGGDIKTAAMAVLTKFPAAVKGAAGDSVREAVAKRVEELEGAAKAAEFRQRAEADGLWDAVKWGGGGTLGGFLWLLGMLRHRGKERDRSRGALATVAAAVDRLPEDIRAQVVRGVQAGGGVAFRGEIDAARGRVSSG